MLKTKLKEELLGRFNDFLALSTGLYFAKKSWPELEKKLGRVAKEFGFNDVATCLEWLLKTPLKQDQINVLAYHLTVGETYFFRDQRLFYFLQYDILPAILKKHQHDKTVRIWSAACCSGEEPYSVAILLNEMLPDIQNWNISIYGSDINRKFLHKAELGLYKSWSFRCMPKHVQNKYFKKAATHFTLDATIKKMVQFSYANLVEGNPAFLTNIDLIICNNVLIYFSTAQIQKAIMHLRQALAVEGWLIVTPIEVPYVKDKYLHTIGIDNYIFFQKKNLEKAFADKLSASLSPSWIVKNHNVALSSDDSHSQLSQVAKREHRDKNLSATLPAAKKVNEKIENEISAHIHFLADAGRLEEAKVSCEQALMLDKVNPQLHFLHATILELIGDQEGAVAALKRVLFLDQSWAFAHFMLGFFLKRQGLVKEAMRHYRNALQLLEKCESSEIVPGSHEMSVGTLRDIIKAG